jgi:peptide/nickel transport system substrate-binding protein
MKNKRAPFLALGALVAVALAVTGCGGGSSTNAGSQNSEAQPGGTLRFGLEKPPTLEPEEALYPSETYVIAQFSEGLVKNNRKGDIEPLLATAWSHSKDNLAWTFHLRKGVKFSDGSPLTAEDVVFTMERLRHGEIEEPTYKLVSNVKATSPTTVVIETSKPMGALLPDLATNYSTIIPDNFGGVSAKEFGQHPIGTGPFMLKSWHHGQSITLVKNPHYWMPKRPLLDKVVFTVTANEPARVAQMRGGALDLTRVSPLGVKTSLAQEAEVSLNEFPGVLVNWLHLNSLQEPFKNQKMREAANLALDREGIAKAASDSKASLGTSYLNPWVRDFRDVQPPARVGCRPDRATESQRSGLQREARKN